MLSKLVSFNFQLLRQSSSRRKEIIQLRVILQSIEARERERTWLRGKVLGEFLGVGRGSVDKRTVMLSEGFTDG